MKKRNFATALAILFIVVLIAPSAFLIVPQSVRAYIIPVPLPTVEVPVSMLTLESVITALKSTISAALDVTNTAAGVAMQINAYVLQPLAFVLSGNLLKMITAGVINFVIGKTNATGIPQFVVDVQKSLQTVGDAKALAFFDQFGRNSNSPFASSITSSLRNNYFSKTSLAGFWAANMNTLAQSTPSYAPGFLAGNWSQGGVAAWFALTTQIQNNPYTFYQTSQSQLSSLVGPGVGGATGARIAELGWGNGFTSWCGAAGTSYTPGANGSGVNPGDPCVDADGNASTIKTPGSVIVASLNKALGSQQDSILRMGNVGPEINTILRNVATVMQTVNFATQLLGGSGSGGLFGVDQPSGSSQSPLRQFAPTTPSGTFDPRSNYLGSTQSSVYQGAATLPSSGADMLNRIVQYGSAWNTIKTSADAASTSVRSLATFCTAAANDAERNPTLYTTASFITASREQATTALAALAPTGAIGQVLNGAAAAAAAITVARATVQRVQNELNSTTTDAATSNYTTDLQTLQSMSPTVTDVANVQQDAQVFNGAEAIPAGSLTVVGSSLVDQMALIATNAEALKTTVCTPTTVSGAPY